MDTKGEWPTGYGFSGSYLLDGTKIALPLGLQPILIRQHHEFMVHVDFARLWHHMDLKFSWADRSEAKKFAKSVMRQCVVCQACNCATRLKGCIESSPNSCIRWRWTCFS